MSAEPSRMARDVTLTVPVQEEMDSVINGNMTAMNKEQLRSHIQEINTGLVALTRLPTTNRLSELMKEKQSVNDAEARISELLEEWKRVVAEKDNLRQELTLTHQKITELEGRTPVCSHGNLEEKVRTLERQLEERDQTELAGELEDAQAQLIVMSNKAEEYWEQVTRILRLTDGKDRRRRTPRRKRRERQRNSPLLGR
jgi:predicted nuclease with TOPRIM domain